jgi:CheY-like chemotaxis protein
MTTTSVENYNVLMVEDDLIDQYTTGFFLERRGYTVGRVSNGNQALTEAMRGIYDLVILDLGLPGIDGKEVLAPIRKSPDLPAIPLTQNGSSY